MCTGVCRCNGVFLPPPQVWWPPGLWRCFPLRGTWSFVNRSEPLSLAQITLWLQWPSPGSWASAVPAHLSLAGAGTVGIRWFWPCVSCTGELTVCVGRYIPEGLGCSCGPDWYTHNEQYNTTSYIYFLMVTCFIMPLSIIIFCYSQLLGALRAVSQSINQSASTKWLTESLCWLCVWSLRTSLH